MIKAVDELLNGLTMYRVLVYALSSLAVIAILFSFTGVLTLSGPALGMSLGTLLVACYFTNKILAKVWRAMPSSESWLITALILFFILPPTNTASRLLGLVGVAIMAMASKYLLAYRRKHIFNPAAVALVLGSLLGISSGVWWVGSKTLFPIMVLIGLLVLRKLRHFWLFAIFAAASIITTILFNLNNDLGLPDILQLAILSSPLMFLGVVMLTEPATMPSTKGWRWIFAAVVGGLSVAEVSIIGRSLTAEMALVAGNALAFMVSPKYKTRLEFAGKQPVAEGSSVYNFVFRSSEKLTHRPGQYVELTLPHPGSDSRGSRRVFTIASSPTEAEVHFGVKINKDRSSSFKRALMTMEPGQKLMAGQLAGSFTLPSDKAVKLLFVAGGIGVTPFRSMAKQMIDAAENRDVLMIYMLSSPSDMAYRDVFEQAAKLGFKTMPVLSAGEVPAGWRGMTGPLTVTDIKKLVADISQRRVYISGPPGMVNTYKKVLLRAGAARRNIVTDHFAGY
jgi:glycine betaine catabolism B